MATSEAFKQGDTHDDTTTTLARQHDARTCPRLHTRTSYSSLHHSTSDLTDKKQRITKHLAELTRHAQPLITLIEKPDVLQSLKHDRAANLAMMVKEHGFDAVKDYGVLAGYGRALFDCGQYAKAAEVLTHVGALVCQCLRVCVCVCACCLSCDHVHFYSPCTRHACDFPQPVLVYSPPPSPTRFPRAGASLPRRFSATTGNPLWTICRVCVI